MKKIVRTALVTFLTMILMTTIVGGCAPEKLEAEEPYVIGYMGDMTGPTKFAYAREGEGFLLYMEALNARGGINGHPVKVVVEDNKTEPARAGALAKKLIEEDKVLAICGLGFTTVQPIQLELAKEAGVATIAGFSASGKVWSPEPERGEFAANVLMNPGCLPIAYVWARTGQQLYPEGSRIALTGYTSPGARFWVAEAQKWLEDSGYEVVFTEGVPAGTVDLTPWAVKISEIDPAALFICMGSELITPLLVTLSKYGWEGDTVLPAFVNEEDVVKVVARLKGNGENIMWLSRYVSCFDELSELDKIRDAMGKYGAEYALSANHICGWTMAMIVEQALTKAGWPCSRADMITALEQVDLDTRGLTGGPIRYSPTDHHGPSWWRIYRWDAANQALRPDVDWFKVVPEEVIRK